MSQPVPAPAQESPAANDAPASVDEAPSEPVVPTQNVKQQIVEKVNGAKNLLVTVGAQPSVDELSAALGLTFLLGKLGKHVTAVFSGKTPPAIDFLDPDKTFERTVDSLRDFIIALDKEKADKLRYKVEDDVVKVYITPYKTTITEKDLTFSQGDFNVDVVIALGVTQREELDKAITAHGRILHDAEVITINANGKTSNLGSVDWVDDGASSLSEMLMSVSESFGSGLVDEQISTAFLTGIVAETNRFSNEKTSPKVMTMAAQLMAAGANQQLIASNLRQEGAISESLRTQKSGSKTEDSEVVVDHDKKPKKPKGDKKAADDTTLDKSKPEKAPLDPVPAKPTPKEQSTDAPVAASLPPLPTVAPATVSTPVAPETVAPVPGEPKVEVKPDNTMIPPAPATPADAAAALPGDMANKPAFGGDMNATSGEEEDQKQEQLAEDRTSEENVPVEDDALAEARKALEDVVSEQPAGAPDPQASAPVHAPDAMNPDGSAGENQASTAAQNTAAASPQPEPSPMDSFMQPHEQSPQAPNQLNNPEVAPAAPGVPQQPGGNLPPMPPLPPMPGADSATGMPPMPPAPAPGQPSDPTAGFQPQTTPAFMQNVPQSQNSWTQAGQDLASDQASKDAERQKKLDDMAADYDAAVDKNREMQGKPPINNDHSTFPLPPSK